MAGCSAVFIAACNGHCECVAALLAANANVHHKLVFWRGGRRQWISVTAAAVAHHYRDLLDGYILDDSDRAEADALVAGGLAVGATQTVMNTLEDRIHLARFALGFAAPR